MFCRQIFAIFLYLPSMLHAFATFQHTCKSALKYRVGGSGLYATAASEHHVLENPESGITKLDDTIISALVDRAQYPLNTNTYQPNERETKTLPLGVDPNNEFLQGRQQQLSQLETILIGTEVLHGMTGKFNDPTECAFFPECLPSSQQLSTGDTNLNKSLLQTYIDSLVSTIAKKEHNVHNDGSSVLTDVALLQALSKRIHYGKCTAERKYQSNTEEFDHLIESNDVDGVRALLSDTWFDSRVVMEAKLKFISRGRGAMLTKEGDEDEQSERSAETKFVATAAASAATWALEAIKERGLENSFDKLELSTIEDLYTNVILPMTVDVEVTYLLQKYSR